MDIYQSKLLELEEIQSHLLAICEYYSTENTSLKDAPAIDFEKYADLSHRETVLKLARENGGRLLTKDATEVFKQKVDKPENAAATLFSTIARLSKQGRMVKVGPGDYLLSEDGEILLPFPTQDEDEIADGYPSRYYEEPPQEDIQHDGFQIQKEKEVQNG